ncbi:MAG: bacillithiol transferase BstA [Flavisolibacter sp.]
MDYQYPIGKYEPKQFSEPQKQQWLGDIKFLPNAVEAAISNLDEMQLQTPYRKGGWTLHQLVHHIADSHINAYIRFKLGYTENHPTIKPYKEKLWAETKDVKELPVNISLTLLHALHHRWHQFLAGFTDADWKKTVFHPEQNKEITLWFLLGMYAWHSRHHVAHINNLRLEKNW